MGQIQNGIWIFILLVSIRALSFDPNTNDWLELSHFESAGYHYFVTSHDGESDLIKARQKARAQVLQQILTNYTPALINVNNVVIESHQGFEINKYISEKFPRFQIKSLQEVAFQKKQRYWYFLFRIKSSEIQKLSTLEVNERDNVDMDEFTQIQLEKGVGKIQILSEPKGAYVEIDGRGWGVTPVVLHNTLKAGSYSVKLSLEGFQSDEFKIVNNGTHQVVSRKLRPKIIELILVNVLKDATVTINGKVQPKVRNGRLSFKTQLDPNRMYFDVGVTHPDIFKLKQTVYVIGDVTQYELSYQFKMGSVQIECLSYPCDLYINNEKHELRYKKTFSLPAGQIVIQDANQDKVAEFYLKANENKSVTNKGASQKTRKRVSDFDFKMPDFLSQIELSGGFAFGFDSYDGATTSVMSASLLFTLDEYNGIKLGPLYGQRSASITHLGGEYLLERYTGTYTTQYFGIQLSLLNGLVFNFFQGQHMTQYFHPKLFGNFERKYSALEFLVLFKLPDSILKYGVYWGFYHYPSDRTFTNSLTQAFMGGYLGF